MKKTAEKVSAAREKIIETALKLFYAHGIRATGIDTIIHSSDVAKMTFYKHFPSKQALVLETLRRGEERFQKQFHEVVDQAETPKERLLAIFDFLGVWFKNTNFRGCVSINTLVETSDNQAAECRLANEHKRGIALFIEKTALEAGCSKKNSVELAKKLLLLYDGAVVRALMDRNPQAARTAKSMAELVLNEAFTP